MPSFPMLRLLEKHGNLIALLMGLALPVFGVVLVWNTGASWIWPPALTLVGIVVYAFVRSYVELVRLMVDMLLPK